MLKSFRISMVFLGWMVLLTGVVYPAFITLVGNAFFPRQATGSMIIRDEKVVGSELIGQEFVSDRYFQSRPSTTNASAYNSAFSGGSNLAVAGNIWEKKTLDLAYSIANRNGDATAPLPIDLVTSSASGLDPHISVASARYQAERVAGVRGLPLEKVNNLIDLNTAEPDLGFLGEPRVNVLLLNLALDELQ
jgi:potassium-transporting ATPase KdpC subunit